jgi:uncharacterized protein DUF6279
MSMRGISGISGVIGYRSRGRWCGCIGAWRWIVSTAAALLLSSCTMLNVGTMNVAYEHADWLLQRMASHYVDFDAGQAQVVRTGFGTLHAWHRSQELPLYAELMDAAASRIERGLRREDLLWMQRSINERWKAMSQRLAAEATPVLVTLTPQQLAQMERRLAEDNAKFAKTQANGDVNKANRYRAEWLIDQIARWTGELTSAQKARVELSVKQTQDFPALRLAERRRRQAHFLQLVRSTRDPDALGNALNEMLIAPREGADEAYRRGVARYEEQMIQMLLDIDHTLSPGQRATAAARMRRYAQNFRTLALGRTVSERQ